jgi:hypothetical protein
MGITSFAPLRIPHLQFRQCSPKTGKIPENWKNTLKTSFWKDALVEKRILVMSNALDKKQVFRYCFSEIERRQP